MPSPATLLAGTLAVLVGALPAARWERWGPWHALAAAVVAYPVLEDLVAFARVASTITQPTTLEPYTPRQLAELPWRLARGTLGVPALGLAGIALAGGVEAARRRVAGVWRGVRAHATEVGLGVALLPAVVAAEGLALLALQGPASVLQTGDEAALFANATWANVVLFSLVPALVEEAYYRGLLQGLVEELLPSRVALHGAVAVQAVLFGLAHGGYGNLAHLLGPLAFGLAMGYVRTMGGLGACAVAHAGVNLLYFSVDPGAGSLGLQAAVAVATLVGVVTLIWLRGTLRARWRAGPRPVNPPRS
jgi:membrane protease YdiL (CAAX protease family)